jgi:hypothetical protein
MADGLAALSRRVDRLDAPVVGPPRPYDPIADVERFLIIMAGDTEPVKPEAASSEDADRLVDGCALVARLAAAIPAAVVGPFDPGAQYWIGTGKPRGVSTPGLHLDRQRFVAVTEAADVSGNVKPFSVGLFTSTAVGGTYGMWHTYLETSQSSLFPRPWQVWAVHPKLGARVCEITTADQWVQFVAGHPAERNGLIYPDWRAAAQRFDAVHMTVRAIVAVQGIPLRSAAGVTAPAYWDVESTFWLRWCFRSTRLVRASD